MNRIFGKMGIRNEIKELYLNIGVANRHESLWLRFLVESDRFSASVSTNIRKCRDGRKGCCIICSTTVWFKTYPNERKTLKKAYSSVNELFFEK